MTPRDAAEDYAERGWRCLLIPPGRKYPSWEDWPRLATDDVEVLDVYFDRYPNHGVGIATGAGSGIFVIDVDVKGGKVGDRTLADLEAVHGELPETFTVETPSGGRHYFFRYEPDRPVGSGRDKLGKDIDHRGDGGLVVAPPTVDPATGRCYRVVLDVPVADAPDWVHELLVEAPRTAPTSTPAPADVDDASTPAVYNRRTTWAEVLEADGWTFHHKDGKGTLHWTRPGKDRKDGSSATTNYDGRDVLKVFSSEVPGLQAGAAYNRFSYYAATRHGDDQRAAADALAAEGYGIDLLDWVVERRAPEATTPAPDDFGLRPGGEWLASASDETPAVWGQGDEVLWAKGEPFYLVGPPGVGKTTLTGQLVRARLLDEPLGVVAWPVERGEGRVLYLACDRPRQIQRSLARQLADVPVEALDDRLRVLHGPPAADFAHDTSLLLRMCEAAGADTVVVDSLKDVAVGLSEDEVGGAVNRAIQLAIAAGVEVLVLHHQRKGAQGGPKPKSIDDVYGSTWLTSGAGSVLLLWGRPGDLVVELVHLKQPAEVVGPLKVEHDHARGVTTLAEGTFDVLDFLRKRGDWVTAADVARAQYATSDPDDSQRATVRRRLNRLVTEGSVEVEPGTTGGTGGATPGRYRAARATADGGVGRGR